MPERIAYNTVAVFDTAVNAWIFANRLADYGLNPRLIDEHVVSMVWIYANALGGIKVQLPEKECDTYSKLKIENPKPQAKYNPVPIEKGIALSERWSKPLTVALIIFAFLYLVGSSYGWIDKITPPIICPVGEPPWY